MQNDILTAVRKELGESVVEATRQGFHRFFKEDVRFYGVNTSGVRRIAKKYFDGIKDREKQEVFALCEELFTSGYCEEAFRIADILLADKEDLLIFSRYRDILERRE